VTGTTTLGTNWLDDEVTALPGVRSTGTIEEEREGATLKLAEELEVGA